jgi:hypothetical protein
MFSTAPSFAFEKNACSTVRAVDCGVKLVSVVAVEVEIWRALGFKGGERQKGHPKLGI